MTPEITPEMIKKARKPIDNPYKKNTGPSYKWYRKQKRIKKIAQASRRRNRE